MIGAIVKDNIVENLIVLDDAQKAELEAALSCEIVDARPYGLIAGDLRTANGWTRNAGGEQVVLPLLEQETYDSYSLAVESQKAAEARAEAAETEAAEAKEAVSSAAESGAQEAIDILSGNVEEE